MGKVIGGIARTLFGRHRDVLDRPPQIERLRKALDRIGYHLEPVTASPPSPREEARRGLRSWLRRVWVAWPLGLLVSGLTMFFGVYPWARWLAFIATVTATPLRPRHPTTAGPGSRTCTGIDAVILNSDPRNRRKR